MKLHLLVAWGLLLYTATATAESNATNSGFALPDGLHSTIIAAPRVIGGNATVKLGDRVDILATYHDPRIRSDVTKVLMQNVLVLALYQKGADPSHTRGDSMALAVANESTALVEAAGKAAALSILLHPVDEKAVGPSRQPVGDFWLPGEFERLLDEIGRAHV